MDAWALGLGGPWDFFSERMNNEHPMERGVVSDRVEFARLAAEASDNPLVAVMGSSRAHASMHTHLLKKAAPGIEVAALAHAGMHPFEIRGALDEVLALEPELVVILISEFDTHRPLRLMPQTSPGSFAALRELASQVGGDFVWEQRTTFLQVALASVVDLYRYREVFHVAGVEDYRMFSHPAAPRGQGVLKIPYLLEGNAPLDMNMDEELQQLELVYPHLSLRARKAGMTQCQSITRGPHATVQMFLLRKAVVRARSKGVRVLLVEGPLAPATKGFYDNSIRTDFLELAQELSQEEGVLFLALEESGPFPQEIFADLTHLNREGAQQMSAAVGRRVANLLELPGP